MHPQSLSAFKDISECLEAAMELLDFIDLLINEDMKEYDSRDNRETVKRFRKTIKSPQPIDEEAEIERTVQFSDDYSSMIVDEIKRP